MAVQETESTASSFRIAQEGFPKPYVVFISHSARDSWIAQIVAEKLRALGAEPWLDVKDLAGGDVLTD